ncbi:MAG TPA: zinc-binding dehydrogenase [Candidatus Latescibacteria bacterium]|nr:zinc-binding dehydrogenase [Candidatus Latescibacterota bacterium]HJP31265.1 zinc-binding dehydrogenase [Candidatus Latescibacterota bacterium]
MVTHAVARVFDGPERPLRQQEFALPDTLAEGEVLVAVRLATLCGSDLHTIEGRRTESTPAILGHEGVGEVVHCGSGRDGLRCGDRVTWSIADSCGHCAYCTDFALPEKCARLFKYGHATVADGHGLNGTYASHIVLRRGTRVLPVADSLNDSVVAPANCALATVANVLSHVPASAASVLVQGAGLLGIYACAWLRDRGVRTVFCTDPVPERRQLAQRFGARPLDCDHDSAGDRQDQIRSVAPEGVDAVLELSGSRAALLEGIDHIRTGGVCVLAGMVHPDSDLGGLTGERIIRKCLALHGVHNYSPHHLEEGLAFLERTVGHLPFADLVSPALPLSRFEEAIELSRQCRWLRVAVTPAVPPNPQDPA